MLNFCGCSQQDLIQMIKHCISDTPNSNTIKHCEDFHYSLTFWWLHLDTFQVTAECPSCPELHFSALKSPLCTMSWFHSNPFPWSPCKSLCSSHLLSTTSRHHQPFPSRWPQIPSSTFAADFRSLDLFCKLLIIFTFMFPINFPHKICAADNHAERNDAKYCACANCVPYTVTSLHI